MDLFNKRAYLCIESDVAFNSVVSLASRRDDTCTPPLHMHTRDYGTIHAPFPQHTYMCKRRQKLRTAWI